MWYIAKLQIFLFLFSRQFDSSIIPKTTNASIEIVKERSFYIGMTPQEKSRKNIFFPIEKFNNRENSDNNERQNVILEFFRFASSKIAN